MVSEKFIKQETCAILLLDDDGGGLEDCSVVTGFLRSASENVYFENSCEGSFAVPRSWLRTLLSTPPDRKSLTCGCEKFIAVSRHEVEAKLEETDLEHNWPHWSLSLEAEVEIVH